MLDITATFSLFTGSSPVQILLLFTSDCAQNGHPRFMLCMHPLGVISDADYFHYLIVFTEFRTSLYIAIALPR